MHGVTTHSIPAGLLAQLMREVFLALQVAPDDTELVVDALMEATLSGYDSHGVMRIPRYAQALRRGEIAAQGAFAVQKETPATAWVDAGNALGPVTAARAVELACAKANATGIGCVSTFRSNDVARLGSYVRTPAQAGLVAILAANDSGGLPTVAPHGGVGRFFSTNPLAAGIPRGQHEPLVIDIATSMTSVGRLRMDAQRGNRVPAGWLIDAQGEAVLDPARFFDDPQNVSLLPLGGVGAGHKGFGLQLLIEVLAGALGGAGVVNGTDPGFEANAIFVLALDPEHFTGRARFLALVEELCAGLEQAQPLPGHNRVRLPGARAAAARAHRTAHGVPLLPVTVAELAQTLLDLELDPARFGLRP